MRPSAGRLRLEARRSRSSVAVIGVGLVISIATGLAVLAQLELRWPWTDALRFEVTVASAFGVKEGSSRVKVAGVPAGRITGVRRGEDGAILRVEVDPDFGPVRSDAVIRLRPRTQLQDMYLDIVDRGRGVALREGDRLAASRSRTSVPISDVLDTFQAPTRRRLRTLLAELASGLPDGGEDLRRVFAELVPFLRAGSGLAAEAAARDRLVRRLVRNSRVLFEELGRRDRALGGFVADGGATLGAVADERRALGEALRELPATIERLRTASGALTTALRRTDPALVALRAPVRRLPSALAAVDRLGTRARPALTELDRALRELAPAVRSSVPAAALLRRTASAVAPQLPHVDRVADDVVACRYALNKFFQHTLSFYKYRGPYGPIGRSELVYGSASALGQASPSEEVGPMCYDRARAR